MQKVKNLIAAGASIPTAIKELLPLGVLAFAEKHGVSGSDLSAAINGTRRATDAMVAVLAAELGGTEAEWRELLWQAGRPPHIAA